VRFGVVGLGGLEVVGRSPETWVDEPATTTSLGALGSGVGGSLGCKEDDSTSPGGRAVRGSGE